MRRECRQSVIVNLRDGYGNTSKAKNPHRDPGPQHFYNGLSLKTVRLKIQGLQTQAAIL